MTAPATELPPILKGVSFTQRLEEVCRELPPGQRLPGSKYQRVLIPGMLGGEIQFLQLACIGHALRLRGAQVTGLLCDEFLPACTLRKADHYESACTRWCHKNSGPFMRAARLPHHWYSEFVTPQEKQECLRIAAGVKAEEIPEFVWRDVPLGGHVDLSVESFFKVGRCDLDNPEMLAKAREFLAAGMCLTLVGERALERLAIDKVVMEDGMKTDWGVIRAVARKQGIPVDVLLGASRGAAFLIEHDRSPLPSDPLSFWPQWRDVPLTDEQNDILDAYFARRALRPYEDQDWVAVAALDDPTAVRRAIGLPPAGAGLVFGIFPNLGYDAGMCTRNAAYESGAEWVAATVRFFAQRPQHHLVVKVHPAESLREALDPTIRLLGDTFAQLPPNVHVLPPETPLTAPDVLRVVDVALVYTSTVGVEAAYLGKPVINTGGGYHAGRGVSIDAATPERYAELLGQICQAGAAPPVDPHLGRRYAYAVFFRSVLPQRFYSAVYPNVTAIHLDSIADLAPGRDPTIDIVCNGILRDEPFCEVSGSLWEQG